MKVPDVVVLVGRFFFFLGGLGLFKDILDDILGEWVNLGEDGGDQAALG